VAPVSVAESWTGSPMFTVLADSIVLIDGPTFVWFV
jgi:hypothetical protein